MNIFIVSIFIFFQLFRFIPQLNYFNLYNTPFPRPLNTIKYPRFDLRLPFFSQEDELPWEIVYTTTENTAIISYSLKIEVI